MKRYEAFDGPERIAVVVTPDGLPGRTTTFRDGMTLCGDEFEYVRADLLTGAVEAERHRIVRQINNAAIQYPRSSSERIALLDIADEILKGGQA